MNGCVLKPGFDPKSAKAYERLAFLYRHDPAGLQPVGVGEPVVGSHLAVFAEGAIVLAGDGVVGTGRV